MSTSTWTVCPSCLSTDLWARPGGEAVICASCGWDTAAQSHMRPGELEDWHAARNADVARHWRLVTGQGTPADVEVGRDGWCSLREPTWTLVGKGEGIVPMEELVAMDHLDAAPDLSTLTGMTGYFCVPCGRHMDRNQATTGTSHRCPGCGATVEGDGFFPLSSPAVRRIIKGDTIKAGSIAALSGSIAARSCSTQAERTAQAAAQLRERIAGALAAEIGDAATAERLAGVVMRALEGEL